MAEFIEIDEQGLIATFNLYVRASIATEERASVPNISGVTVCPRPKMRF
jgi:hypothetical protein